MHYVGPTYIPNRLNNVEFFYALLICNDFFYLKIVIYFNNIK